MTNSPVFSAGFSSTRREAAMCRIAHNAFHSSRGQRPSRLPTSCLRHGHRDSRSGARGGVREESPMISIAQESDSTASIRDGTFREKPGKPELGRKRTPPRKSTQTPRSSSNWTYRYHTLTTQWSAAAHLQPARRQRAQCCKRRLPACEQQWPRSWATTSTTSRI